MNGAQPLDPPLSGFEGHTKVCHILYLTCLDGYIGYLRKWWYTKVLGLRKEWQYNIFLNNVFKYKYSLMKAFIQKIIHTYKEM